MPVIGFDMGGTSTDVSRFAGKTHVINKIENFHLDTGHFNFSNHQNGFFVQLQVAKPQRTSKWIHNNGDMIDKAKLKTSTSILGILTPLTIINGLLIQV